MSTEEKRQRQRERATQKRRRNQIIVAAVVGLGLLAGLGWLVKAKTFAGQSEPGKLIGRWTRLEGGYVLDIRQAEQNGRLDAAYLNPRPIHVAQANYSQSNEQWQVFVELRDVNYPGATYRLTYLPDKDQLAGQYHQPLMDQTLDVTFVRATNEGSAP
jgi:hypothetical protein